MSARKSTRCHYNPITRVDSSPRVNYSPGVRASCYQRPDRASPRVDFLAIAGPIGNRSARPSNRTREHRPFGKTPLLWRFGECRPANLRPDNGNRVKAGVCRLKPAFLVFCPGWQIFF